MNATEQIHELQHLAQQSAAWLCGVSPRTIRDWTAAGLPRAEDGTYDAKELIAFLCRRKPAQPGLVAYLRRTLAERGPVGVSVAVELLPDEPDQVEVTS